MFEKPEEFIALLKDSASADLAVAAAAEPAVAEAVGGYVKEQIFQDALFGELATVRPTDEFADVYYPKDLFWNKDMGEFKAFYIPRIGDIPQRMVESDNLRIPMSMRGNTIGVPLESVRRGDFDVIARALDGMAAGWQMSMNDDVFHLVLKTAHDRGFLVVDTAATAGTFSLKLQGQMQTKMRRAGQKYTSKRGYRMNRLYMSPELRETILYLAATDIGDMYRTDILDAEDGKILGFAKVEYVDIDELGPDGVYQKYWDDTLGGTFTNSKTNLVVGVDTRHKDKVVMPVGMNIEIHEDPTLHKEDKKGWYGRAKWGVGALDERHLLLGQA